MGETTKQKLKYPEETDTPDVPRDVKALAEQLDLLVGVGPWTAPSLFNAKLADLGGSTTMVRLEAAGSVARWRGEPSVKAGEELKNEEVVWQMPAEFRPMALVTNIPIIATNEAGLPIASPGQLHIGKVGVVWNVIYTGPGLPAGTKIFLDSTTYPVK